jgi:adenylate cyclase
MQYNSAMHSVMSVWAQNRYHVRTVLLLALVFVIGFELLLYLIRGSFSRLDTALVVFIGIPVGLLVGILEVYVVPRVLTNKALGIRFLVSTVLQLLTFGLLLWLGKHFIEVVHHEFAQNATITRLLDLELAGIGLRQLKAQTEQVPLGRLLVLYGLLVTSLTVVYQTGRKIGHSSMLRLIMGYYNQPVEEKRLFLFVDLKDSTTLAEQLGNLHYSALVRDFFQDVGAPIAATRGEVYQYVGDEVVVTWPWQKGLRNARCLRCFFGMQQAVERRREYYLQHYGVVPSFKAGLHGGPVISTQVGDIRSELVFHGDVLNTTARIQAKCNALQSRLLVSEPLLRALGPLPQYSMRLLGEFTLRGKSLSVELFDVQHAI